MSKWPSFAVLDDALTNTCVRAFLGMIRGDGKGETNLTDDAYRMVVGGQLIDSLDKHPRIEVRTKWGWSSAAGAYQFMAAVGHVKTDTWDMLERVYGPLDFSHQTQDRMGVALIWRRGALDAVMGGRVHEGIRLCGDEWASLPGSRWGQSRQTLEGAIALYQSLGGTVADSPAPVALVQERKPMAPLIPILLESLAPLIPQLGSMFAKGEVAQRNVAAGTIVSKAITDAVGAVNLQEAAEKIQNDPQALDDAKQAVAQVVMELGEVGGGIDAARKSSAQNEGDWRKVFISVPMVVIFMLMPIVYFVVYNVVVGADWSAEIKASVVSAVISGVLFAIVGFALGTSYGSQKKDALLGK